MEPEKNLDEPTDAGLDGKIIMNIIEAIGYRADHLEKLAIEALGKVRELKNLIAVAQQATGRRPVPLREKNHGSHQHTTAASA